MNKVSKTKKKGKLTLGDDQMFELMKLAHERDVTLNQMVEIVLRNAIAIHQDADEIEEFDESGVI